MKHIRAITLFVIGGAIGWAISTYLPQLTTRSLVIPAPTPVPTPLMRYAFSTLQEYKPQSSPISLIKTMTADDKVVVYEGMYTTQGKQMSMQLMVPQTATPSGGFPIILMNRGFIDPAQYQIGTGTKNAAKYFANNGFVTIAPDFLGYGDSDAAPEDTMEARLEKPQQLQDLLASIHSLPFVNAEKMGLWGHSNGGQITLSLLEVTQKPFPTVLWAPVSKPFPYSLLYYTDEYDDGGKALRQVVAHFETIYDVHSFSLDTYWASIATGSAFQIHQGTADEEVPERWSKELAKLLKEKHHQVTYYVYPDNDHNLRPDWQTVVERSLAFYKESLYGE
jgi:dipeptidyl aminopeptidase/acylaminoacyl peptidase